MADDLRIETTPCPDCADTTRCAACGGDGQLRGAACAACLGTGSCATCLGAATPRGAALGPSPVPGQQPWTVGRVEADGRLHVSVDGMPPHALCGAGLVVARAAVPFPQDDPYACGDCLRVIARVVAASPRYASSVLRQDAR